MLEVYKILYDLVNPLCPCYVDHYPDTEEKIYPYCEIKFPNVVDNNSNSDNYFLELNVFDNKAQDIRNIENLTDSIHNLLKNKTICNANMAVYIKDNTPYRLKLDDPLTHIQSRQIRLVLLVYKI